MTKEQKQKWIEALRSGNFNQARGVLKVLNYTKYNDTAYCCLGVAEHIFGLPRATAEEAWGPGQSNSNAPCGGFVTPKFLPMEIQRELSKRNDGVSFEEPWTFAQIADFIEQEIKADDESP